MRYVIKSILMFFGGGYWLSVGSANNPEAWQSATLTAGSIFLLLGVLFLGEAYQESEKEKK